MVEIVRLFDPSSDFFQGEYNEPFPHLWCIVVTGSGGPNGEPPVLISRLVLLLHVTGLVPHTVAVLQGCWRQTPGVVRVFAGTSSLLYSINININIIKYLIFNIDITYIYVSVLETFT